MADNDPFKSSIIDVPRWDQAQWRGVLYMVDLSFQRPPILGLIFRREAPAVEIFTGWRGRVGPEDEEEQIRIAVVEGDIPGQDYGYTVHISVDPDFAHRKADQQFDRPQGDMLVGVSRVYRMNPDRNSKNLPNFKRAYGQVGKLLLIPVIANSGSMTASSLKPRIELGIAKSKIIFRNVKDIGKGDFDSVVFAKSH